MTAGFGFSERDREAVYRAIHQRRDVRNYRPDPVPDETLARILEAAHRAPSVGFMQPWNFVLLRSLDLRKKVYEHFSAVNAQAAEVWQDDRRRAYQSLKLQGILDAPLNLLVTCDRNRGGEHVLGRFSVRDTDLYSTCLAVQNLWLAARAEGIGVGWMSIMQPGAIAELLELPEGVVPVAYLTLGVPVEFAERPMLSQVGWEERLPLRELVFEDRWGATASWLDPPQPAAAVELSSQLPSDHTCSNIAPAPPLLEVAQARNRELTKPLGSLGKIEQLALKLAALQGTAYPRCDAVHLALFAGDHGVTQEGVSAFRANTTVKLVYSYLAGGGVVNAFARDSRVPVHVVDVGVDHDFGQADGLLQRKVRRGTRNFAREAAMSVEECERAIQVGRDVVFALPVLQVLLLGEVGIGNSTSAAALSAALLGLSCERTVGRGTGLSDAGVAHKRAVVARALSLHGGHGTDESLRRLGGFEIAALVGAIEAAAQRGALVVLDGVITGVAALVAARRTPTVASYFVAAHLSMEPAHAPILDALALAPLMSLEMRLGEGSAAVLAVGLLRAACAMMSDVRTYEEANITRPDV
jgi:nicotinate-nucleotide--dimethylbenzimidazole phosphoribosyltransferase